MKRIILVVLLVAFVICLFFTASAEGLRVHIADIEEGRQLITSCTDYYAGISEKALEFFLQKKNGTIDEYVEYSAEQVREFSDEASAYILGYYNGLEAALNERGLGLPECGEITVVATTCNEATGAGGYTHGTTIYLNLDYVDALMSTGNTALLDEILAHELFHCLTRGNPEFRAEMYGIIGFTVNDAEFDIPEEIAEQVIANPDVEHHDSYAAFTINGEKTDCYLLFMADGSFENPGDSFFATMYTGIVPVGGDVVYRAEDTEDFWDVVGRNTYYVEDPEECMAVNFSYAIVRGTEGPNGNGYNTPEIIEAILDNLKLR